MGNCTSKIDVDEYYSNSDDDTRQPLEYMKQVKRKQPIKKIHRLPFLFRRECEKSNVVGLKRLDGPADQRPMQKQSPVQAFKRVHKGSGDVVQDVRKKRAPV